LSLSNFSLIFFSANSDFGWVALQLVLSGLSSGTASLSNISSPLWLKLSDVISSAVPSTLDGATPLKLSIFFLTASILADLPKIAFIPFVFNLLTLFIFALSLN